MQYKIFLFVLAILTVCSGNTIAFGGEIARDAHIFATIQTKFNCPRLKRYENNFVAIKIFRSPKDTYFIYDGAAEGLKFGKAGGVSSRRLRGAILQGEYKRGRSQHDLKLRYLLKDYDINFRYKIALSSNGKICQLQHCEYFSTDRLVKKYCELGCRVEFCEVRNGSPF